jgi:uncharacterized protein
LTAGANHTTMVAVQSELRVVELTAEQFCSRASALLVLREAENGLPWGIALRLANSPPETRAVLLVVEDAGEVVAACVWTPPQDVVVTRLPPGAAALMAAHLTAKCQAMGWTLSGAMGPLEHGLELAKALAHLGGGGVSAHKRQFVYELVAVNDVPHAKGNMRQADLRDLELVADWCSQFVKEANIPLHTDTVAWAHRAITSGSTFLWEHDDRVRSFACWSRETPNGRSIGPVFTPPDSRRHGYATSLVAEISRRILASGKRFAALFTDANNPTSNHIYTTIGYRMVCKYDSYLLVPRV